MKLGGRFEALLRKKKFTDQIVLIVFDEAHCIMTWGKFRPEYKELGWLQFLMACHVPYLITSATLTPDALHDIMKVLDLHWKEDLVIIQTHTDQPNSRLCIQQIKYPLTSYKDLAFLVPDGWTLGNEAPPKFLIFFWWYSRFYPCSKVLSELSPLYISWKDHLVQLRHDDGIQRVAGHSPTIQRTVEVMHNGGFWDSKFPTSIKRISCKWWMAGNGHTRYRYSSPVESDM